MNFVGSNLQGGGTIIYHRNEVIGVNKNPGTLVHPIKSIWGKGSLIEQVKRAIGRQVHLGHRLDYDTSGVVLLSPCRDTVGRISKSLEHRTGIEKKYRALVSGEIKKESGTIRTPIFDPGKGKKCFLSNDGKPSETHYMVRDQREVTIGKTSLILSELEIEIKTGRRHQIRVHCASKGFPIIGDSLYGDHRVNCAVKKEFGLTRQALHAHRLMWDDPKGDRHIILGPLPDDMRSISTQLFY